ncbi:unnamed protein product [Urochloa humidicola]
MQTSLDAASSLSTTSAEGSLEQQQQPAHEAASPPTHRTQAAGGVIRCQNCWLLAKADGCAHRRCRTCCTGRGFVCPAHVTPSSHAPASPPPPCSVRQRLPDALTRKRPRRLDSVATSPTTTSSSVGQPTAAAAATVLEGFAREVSLDAVFRRVRLGPDDAEVAYHATVTIGGHVFRGVLYDVGRARGRRRRSAGSTDTGGSSGLSSQSTGGGGGLDLTLSL